MIILKIVILTDFETVSKFKPLKKQIFSNALHSTRMLSLNGRNHCCGFLKSFV
jgi:hypothetical protein